MAAEAITFKNLEKSPPIIHASYRDDENFQKYLVQKIKNTKTSLTCGEITTSLFLPLIQKNPSICSESTKQLLTEFLSQEALKAAKTDWVDIHVKNTLSSVLVDIRHYLKKNENLMAIVLIKDNNSRPTIAIVKTRNKKNSEEQPIVYGTNEMYKKIADTITPVQDTSKCIEICNSMPLNTLFIDTVMGAASINEINGPITNGIKTLLNDGDFVSLTIDENNLLQYPHRYIGFHEPELYKWIKESGENFLSYNNSDSTGKIVGVAIKPTLQLYLCKLCKTSSSSDDLFQDTATFPPLTQNFIKYLKEKITITSSGTDTITPTPAPVELQQSFEAFLDKEQKLKFKITNNLDCAFFLDSSNKGEPFLCSYYFRTLLNTYTPEKAKSFSLESFKTINQRLLEITDPSSPFLNSSEWTETHFLERK